MDITSIPHSRYASRWFSPVLYEQPRQLGYQGGAGGPAVVGDIWGGGPMPGSNRPESSAVWLEQAKEVASLERVHVSEVASRMLGTLAGQWEVQSWTVNRFQADQDTQERQAEASRFMTQRAVDTLLSFDRKRAVAGMSLDIYA